ncbi:metal-binding protein [Candidatus Nitrosoglobus terrae]|uniref:Metal-binding protein n=1 Tax=Candidatus Nitrosoglobus terrae TaxID=1630141 RepID=A0A1Q2SM15_9GAMM|nr:DUF411 domain-containing protein [Candidatus Nitrosoglobus terrae]BAW80147.1 metal-binding protein [Candidatus Nitrosoglobus terrae]
MRLILQFSLGFLLALFAASSQARESVWDKVQISYFGPSNITVYHDPSCGCCKQWIKHLEKHHFTIEDIPTNNVQSIKQQYGIPPKLASCHTAIINGYAIEGHVPADDIKQLLIKQPKVVGLTVPAMPKGTPGMEMGGKKDPFHVLQFDKEGNIKTFSEYRNY